MKLDSLVREKYPEFIAGYVRVSGVTIEPSVEGLVERKREIFSDLKARYGAVPALDISEVKAYRAFFKAMGADPSSYRPAPEFLLRRALDDRFPAINNVVDSCLLATVENWVVDRCLRCRSREGASRHDARCRGRAVRADRRAQGKPEARRDNFARR